MVDLKTLRLLARYSVLTPIFALGAGTAAPALAATINSPTSDYVITDGNLTNRSVITGVAADAVSASTSVTSVRNASGATISSTTHGGVQINGSVGTFDNRGTISTVDEYAVFILGDVADFSNSGSISTDTTSAIYINGDVGKFVNSGAIASEDSDAVYFSGDVESFINNGTITSGGYGDPAVNLRGDVTSFSNTNTISADSGYGVWVGGSTGSFSNSGTIESGYSAVTLGSGYGPLTTVESFINSGTIHSYGEDGGYDYYSAVMIHGNIGSFENTATGNISAEEIAVKIDGTVGKFVNAGRIASGSSTAIYFDGAVASFANSGTISGAVGIVFDDGAGVNAVNSGAIEAFSSKGNAIAFDNGDDTLTLLTGASFVGGIQFNGGVNTLDLTDFHGNMVLKQDGLDTIDEGGNLVTQDDNLVYISSPDAISHSSQATGNVVSGVADALENQLLGGGSLGSGGDDLVVPNMAGTTLWATTSVGGLANGTTEVGTGFGALLAGADTGIGANTTLGGLVGIAGTTTETGKGSQTIDGKTGLAGLYGKTELDIVTLTFQVLGGASVNHSERTVDTPGASELNTADFTGWFVAPQVGISVPVLDDATNSIRLGGSVGFVGGGFSGYSETGGASAMVVDAQTYGLLTAKIDLSDTMIVGKTNAGDIKGTVKGGVFVQSNVGGSSVGVDVYDAAGGTLLDSFTVAAPTGTTFGAQGSLVLDIPVSAQMTFTAGVNGAVRSDGAIGGGVRLGLRGSL